MFKLLCLIVLAFVASSFTIFDELCPHTVEVLCIDDINKGIFQFIQLIQFVKRLLKQKAKMLLQISSACNTLLICKKIAGLAFALSPKQTIGRLGDVDDNIFNHHSYNISVINLYIIGQIKQTLKHCYYYFLKN